MNSWRALVRRFGKEDRGATFLEFTIVFVPFLLILMGIIEFSLVFWQWNTATKAAYRGARLAAVSTPVDSTLKSFTGLASGIAPGTPIAIGGANAYAERSCTGTNNTSGTCANGTYSAAAMARLVYGNETLTSCPATPASPREIGMCHFFPGLTPANVRVVYTHTGLGFAGRPGGPVPTVTVELRNLTFGYFFLSGLSRLTTITMPPLTATVTGEDLATSS
ncbi:TadE/TadG family type IV pilus assembly protein [Prosthecomicrobium sp. N25]|uniref:TadE/TadG family type IV pilus assembly protein n=1 Tax=Prosthecomicrobium sp. N25 TaxID=3129254 RepID=UPI0030784814